MSDQADFPTPVTEPGFETPAGRLAQFCPECGTRHEPDWKFCRNCGHGLSDSGNTAGRPSTAELRSPTAVGYHVREGRLVCNAHWWEDCKVCSHSAVEPFGTPTQATSMPPYGAPSTPPPANYGPPRAQKQSTNGFAIASMVLGIIWIYWVGSILALVFGHMARKQIRESNGGEGGSGMATAGIVLGWIGVATLVAAIVVFILAAATSHPSNTSGYYGG